ncbi:hypothetical protein JQN58_05265 [Aneurinibacillus sp. BA2021]|nr:hypothetical protein [Aneurinibacillus sp. BA2021]
MRSKVFFFVLSLLVKGGEQTMALIATTLIVRGKMSFSDVPVTLQAQVRQMLIDLDMGELAGETAA